MPNMGPYQLCADLPQGTTQYQIQVTPYNNDGPAVNLIRTTETVEQAVEAHPRDRGEQEDQN